MKLSIDVLLSLIENSSLDYRKKNVIGRCPYCGGGEFGVSIENNHLFGCFRKKECGEVGNIFKLLKKVDRLDLIYSPDTVQLSSMVRLEDVISERRVKSQELEEIQAPIGWRRVFSHQYLDDRGFTEMDYKQYEVGTTRLDSKLRDRVVFLIRQGGKLVATVSRTVKSKEEIKRTEELTERRYSRYLNSNTDFSQVLLGIDECTAETDTAILVEGLFGKRNVDEKLELHSQSRVKCLCTFGAKVSDDQLLMLHVAGITSIVLFYDPDVVGQIKKYSSRLLDALDSVKVAMIPWADKDPADLSLTEMEQVLEGLRSVTDFQLSVVQVLKLR